MPFVEKLGYACDVCGRVMGLGELIVAVPEFLFKTYLWLDLENPMRTYYLCRAHKPPDRSEIEAARRSHRISGRYWEFDYRWHIRMNRACFVRANPDWQPPDYLDRNDPIWSCEHENVES